MSGLTTETIAQVCHEANRAWCAANGDHSQPLWERAPDWQRDSAIEGVRFLIANPSAPVSATHESWMDQKRRDGWVYGETKDPEAKTHPCMVPFEELPEHQQAKDRLFQAVVRALANA